MMYVQIRCCILNKCIMYSVLNVKCGRSLFEMYTIIYIMKTAYYYF